MINSTWREFLTIAILLMAIIADSVLSNITDLIFPTISAPVLLAIFSSIAIASIVTGLAIIRVIAERISREVGESVVFISRISRIAKAIQYILIILIAAIVVESIAMGEYLSGFVISAITLSYVSGGILQAILSYKLLEWYRHNRNPVSLIYASSGIVLSVMMILTIIAQSVLLYQSHPYSVSSNSTPQFPIVEGTLGDLVQILLTVPYLLYPVWLLTSWGASLLMLKSYSAVVGRKTFWLLISSVCVVIVIGTLVVYSPTANSGPFDKNLMIFRLIAISSIIVQGLLLGFTFLLVSRNSRRAAPSKFADFTRISAYGVAILFISLSANLAFGAFPPFSVVTWSFAALGSYLFMAGIYSSAISTSTDIKVKRLIKKYLMDKSGFIDSIGNANVNAQLEKSVLSVLNKQSLEVEAKTGFDLAMDDSKVKEYIHDVLVELKREAPTSQKDSG